MGIICACLPACRSLLEYFFPSLKMTFGEANPTAIRTQTIRTQSAKLPRCRIEKNSSSTRSLVELGERSGASESGIERLSTRTLSFHDDFEGKNDGDKDLGIHATVETGPSLRVAEGADSHKIYMTKSVEMVTDKL